MSDKSLKHSDKTNLLYLGLIFLVWLVSYIICQIIFKQKLGWDEVAYMSVAKGIASDFDFGARSYTIMGIIKHGYPTNLINFPIFPIYLAMFFKLFGFSLKIAYFSSWLAALGTCILIYLTFLLIAKSSYKAAFIVAISYLFCPGVIKNCDSAMMEQAGCFLLMLSTYLIFQDYAKGEFTYFTILKISLSLLILWLFKSLFIGFFIGAFVFICLASKRRLTAIFLCFGIFAVLYYILKKYVFYPVAPMMTFSPIQEYTQVYADFLGGYFNNFSSNFLRNLSYFFSTILAPYFIYPAGFLRYTEELLNTPGHFVFLGMYYFLLLVMIVLAFALWKKFSSVEKAFLLFTLSIIVGFNLIFNFLLMSYHSNIWRYNFVYFPIYICCAGIIFRARFE